MPRWRTTGLGASVALPPGRAAGQLGAPDSWPRATLWFRDKMPIRQNGTVPHRAPAEAISVRPVPGVVRCCICVRLRASPRPLLAVAALAAFDPAAAVKRPGGTAGSAGLPRPPRARRPRPRPGARSWGSSPPLPLVDLSPDPDSTWPPPAPAPFGGPIGRRPKLTGDGLGLRNGSGDSRDRRRCRRPPVHQGVTTGGLGPELLLPASR